MKKITLSATVLALTMMGCSDSGLDNSVASTSEVKSDQVLPLDGNPFALAKATLSCDGLSSACAYVETVGSHRYGMQMFSDVDVDNRGFGKINVWKDNERIVTADHIQIISACVQGCDAYGNCPYNKLAVKAESNVSFVNPIVVQSYSLGQYAKCESMSVNHGNVGVVSVYAIVLDAGKSTEVILNGATRKNLSYDQALLVYQKYILPEQLSQAGL